MNQVIEASTFTAASEKTTRHVEPAKLKFIGSADFLKELRERVDAYFETTGRRRRDCPQMYLKTALVLAWFLSTYILLVFVVTNPWIAVLLAMSLGVAVAAIGFNIQHDGAHKAYSDKQWVNKTMALSLDWMGASSYLWDWKHNSIHHTYTNIAGHDDDIDVGFLGRLSPQQPRFAFHRLQGFYLFFLYGFLAIKWHFFDDFYNVARGRIGDHKIPRPHGKDLVIFIAGKVVFFSMALVIPMLFHSWWKVFGIYGIAAFVSGVVMSIVFQLAHCVEDAAFPVPVANAVGDGKHVDSAWAVHQVQTTVDFARANPISCWLLGGLNFQIEHHLFHRICHVNYPAVSKIVESVCSEFGVAYHAHRTFLAALASHFRFLMDMGRPTAD